MKYLVLVLIVLSLVACGAPPAPTPTTQNTPNIKPGALDHTVKENEKAPDGTPLVYVKPSVMATSKDEMTRLTNLLVDNGAKASEVLKLYKDLIATEPKDSPNRTKALRYIMDQNIFLIEAGRGEEALALAFELDALIPQDFYVQNRIIGAYRVIAEKDFKAGKIDDAFATIQKARAVRFDPEAAKTFMKIQFARIQRDINAKKYEDAATKLDDVAVVLGLADNKGLFVEESKQADTLRQVISPHLKGK